MYLCTIPPATHTTYTRTRVQLNYQYAETHSYKPTSSIVVAIFRACKTGPVHISATVSFQSRPRSDHTDLGNSPAFTTHTQTHSSYLAPFSCLTHPFFHLVNQVPLTHTHTYKFFPHLLLHLSVCLSPSLLPPLCLSPALSLSLLRWAV